MAASLPRTHAAPVAPGQSAAAQADGTWAVALAASLGVDPRNLAQFLALMREEGLAVDPSRLFFDAVYACKRLALAHGSGNDTLRAMAVELFGHYQRLEQRRHRISAFTPLQ
jgi:hypothetical protein